jgi:hypothetical protein
MPRADLWYSHVMPPNYQTMEHRAPTLNYADALELAAKGSTIKQIATALGCSPHGLARLLTIDPLFKQALDQARAVGFDTLADEVKTLVTDNPLTDVQMLRLHSDNAKWYLSKMNPARYGDKLDLTITKQVDLRSAILEGRSRTRIVNAEQIEGCNDPFAD